jgi:protein-disulfide isomerase/uncharacterized membrane protein
MAHSNLSRTINRIILGLGFLGILVTVHLGIQQSRGFDMGCLGFSTSAAVEATFDCSAVVASGAGTFLGLSNVVWGLLFYLTVAVVSAFILVSPAARAAVMNKVRAGVIGAGLLYSAYLVYLQFAVIGELCALCMISAGIVGTLALLQGYLFVGPGVAMPQNESKKMKEYRFIGAVAGVITLLVIADLAYFNSLEPARAATPDAAVTAPAPQTAAHQTQGMACSFADDPPPMENYESILTVTDPFKGNPDASVTVIEFFDPNCPHCKTQHQVTNMLIEEYGDDARFFYKPVPLWQFSVIQIDALYAAAQEGKFDEMLDGQFDRQRQGGLSMDVLKEIAREIGMDAEQMEQRIERGIYRNTTMQQREIASQIGLRGVPAVYINGRMVEGRSRTYACLSQLIEEAGV